MNLKSIFVFSVILVTTLTAHAYSFHPLLNGVDSSGGGNAVVCRDSRGRVKSAEVLDLFEARILYGLKIPSTGEESVELAKRQIEKLQALNSVGFFMLDANFDRVLRIAHILPDGVALQPINDSFSPVIPKNCKIEQLAAYQINNELYIDREIWAKLNKTNRAALYAHEAIYKSLREFGATNSIRTRKIVGALFAEKSMKPVLDAPLETGRSFCGSGKGPTIFGHSEIYLSIKDGKATITFILLAGEPVVSRKSLTFDANYILKPDPNTSQMFMPLPTEDFEGGDSFALWAKPGSFEIHVRSAFGDDSLNEEYVFQDCRPQ